MAELKNDGQTEGIIKRLKNNFSSNGGFDPKSWSDANILRYDTGKLHSWGYLFFISGTTITKRSLFGTLTLAIVATFLGLFRCPSDSKLHDWSYACMPYLGDEALALSSLVAFLLGIFGSITFDRWWATRERLQKVMGTSNSLSSMIATYVFSEESLVALAREDICRYLNLAHHLIYKQASEDDDLADLLHIGLLTPNEMELLKPMPSRYMIVYTWLSELCRELATNGYLLYPEYVLPKIFDYIASMQAGAGDIFMFLNCQIPYAYMHLLTLTSKIHVLFVTFYAAGLIGTAINNRSIFSYVFLFATRVVYEGLLQIHHILVNPFGDDADDFPKRTYQRVLRQTTSAIIRQVGKTPCRGYFQRAHHVLPNMSRRASLQSNMGSISKPAMNLHLPVADRPHSRGQRPFSPTHPQSRGVSGSKSRPQSRQAASLFVVDHFPRPLSPPPPQQPDHTQSRGISMIPPSSEGLVSSNSSRVSSPRIPNQPLSDSNGSLTSSSLVSSQPQKFDRRVSQTTTTVDSIPAVLMNLNVDQDAALLLPPLTPNRPHVKHPSSERLLSRHGSLATESCEQPTFRHHLPGSIVDVASTMLKRCLDSKDETSSQNTDNKPLWLAMNVRNHPKVSGGTMQEDTIFLQEKRSNIAARNVPESKYKLKSSSFPPSVHVRRNMEHCDLWDNNTNNKNFNNSDENDESAKIGNEENNNNIDNVTPIESIYDIFPGIWTKESLMDHVNVDFQDDLVHAGIDEREHEERTDGPQKGEGKVHFLQAAFTLKKFFKSLRRRHLMQPVSGGHML